MKLYQLVFDVKGVAHDYVKLYEYMLQFERVQVTERSFWFLSDKKPSELMEDIRKLLYSEPPTTDFFYVMEISDNVDGILPTSCWDWLKEKQKELNKDSEHGKEI